MPSRDLFSRNAASYARHRPTYPDSLFAYLAEACASTQRAWDCATGNGQAARGLSTYFPTIIATDASIEQINQAPPKPGVFYCVAAAERAPLATSYFDLVTVAQAVHWFDRPAFFEEARRVLRPGGVIAVWSYGLTQVSPGVDRLVDHFYHDIVAAYWPPGLEMVDDGYRSLDFPFEEVIAPPFETVVDWTLDDHLAFLRTWSPTRLYIESVGLDPVSEIEPDMLAAWGARETLRAVRFPLNVRVGRV